MLRSGFFNSKKHDKQYYASDVSYLFNSLIKDGVFEHIGDKFIARAGSGMQVVIPSGFAWFNSTWTANDADYVINIDEAPYISNYKRIDGVFLQVFPEDDTNTRENAFYYAKGTETAGTPVKPVPTPTDEEIYVPICYITVEYDDTEVTASKIENMVGKTETPFVTGILETVDITELLAQWSAQFTEFMQDNETEFNTWKTEQQTSYTTWITQHEIAFNEWFETIQDILDESTAGHLQTEIDDLKDNLTSDNGVPFVFGIDNNGDYGYYKQGEANLTPFKTRHTETYKPAVRANNLDMGLYHKKRYVDTTDVPNTNSDTYTVTSNGRKDMGETNTNRFVEVNVPGAISSIQRGSFSANGVGTQNVTISSVDTSKSVVMVELVDRGRPNNRDSVTGNVTARLTSSTNIEISYAEYPNIDIIVSWTVITYSNATVTRGRFTGKENAGSSAISINVNTNRCYGITTACTVGQGYGSYGSDSTAPTSAIIINSASSATVYWGGYNKNIVIDYQVVSFS